MTLVYVRTLGVSDVAGKDKNKSEAVSMAIKKSGVTEIVSQPDSRVEKRQTKK